MAGGVRAAVKLLSFRILNLSSFRLVMGVNYGCRARTRKTRLFRTFTPPPSMKRVQLFPIYTPAPSGEAGITKFCENFQIRTRKIRPVFWKLSSWREESNSILLSSTWFLFQFMPSTIPSSRPTRFSNISLHIFANSSKFHQPRMENISFQFGMPSR